MMLHVGERVSWGAPEVIYLEGTIVQLDEEVQAALVHVDRTTAHSAHLIGSDVPFSADGVSPLKGMSPPGLTSERSTKPQAPRQMSDDEKVQSAAAVAVHQQHGYALPAEEEQTLIEQVAQALNSDPTLRTHIITSMDAILRREF